MIFSFTKQKNKQKSILNNTTRIGHISKTERNAAILFLASASTRSFYSSVAMELLFGVFTSVFIVLVVFSVRLFLVFSKGTDYKPGKKKSPISALVVAGSGGHTTEILRLLGSLSQSYNPRYYVIADTDKMSEDKICTLEFNRQEKHSESQYTIHRIPRSREVCQSWSSSVLTTVYSLLYSLPLVYRLKPDLVLCNGPGTCVPLCVSALLLAVLGIKKAVIVYVESICRVETLSLSGKILYYFSDYFIVQWPSLKEKYPKSIYLGRVV
ncbi:UDP-N-acetylglucosamine transferase subunit ALG14 homolog [Latimeria chalumnae]|uniref:UDP-N-acetylglucosamine transferase subunit ALG14 n=1 Tax=Latimeria chalumnae TaxID=7897 RepID=H3AB44_LATCH|nr:PREDICTED: UDP-N-acetylglucosamine transferase subunit ALG14 homolog [Latimeria chalumnae]|eukprot:XP_006005759.1 PREDICTED: UDP-N-acetylglucosamine transferase subunit ALG14 homolog [Latimeria chalumnae]